MSLSLLLHALAIGIGATALMDLWTLAQSRLFSVRGLDYALVGRWSGHLLKGNWRHGPIPKAAPIPGERLAGWIIHYAVGAAFAAGLLLIGGPEWARNPTLAPAVAVGIGTVVLPFFVLQPALGAGVAASRTPRPNLARLRSLITHTVFGLALYVVAVILKALTSA